MKVSNAFLSAGCLLAISIFFACGETTPQDTIEMDSIASADSLQTKSINPVTVPCPNMDTDSGCSCDFKVGDDYVFRSDYQNGCFNLNGETISVKEAIFEDERSRLIQQSKEEHWIILNENGGNTIFGKKLEMSERYEEHRAELIQTLLVMDFLPSTIPLLPNGTVGMGLRAEVRSMCDEALQMAKMEREQGNTGPSTEMRFQNEKFQVHFILQSTSRDDGGGNYYDGEMKVLGSDGTLLDQKQVEGYCGC